MNPYFYVLIDTLLLCLNYLLKQLEHLFDILCSMTFAYRI